MSRIESTTCYHCDAKNTGREHVPPKCLFPAGRSWHNLITVPSCPVHNNATSKADEYLKFLLGAIVSNVPEEIINSVVRSLFRFVDKGSRNLHQYGWEWNDKVLSIDKKFRLDIDLLRMSLKKIARAIYFYHNGGQRKLLSELYVLPVFVPVESDPDPSFFADVEKARSWIAEAFKNYPKLGTHQEVFAYQIFEKNETIVVNLEFYGRHWVSVIGGDGIGKRVHGDDNPDVEEED